MAVPTPPFDDINAVVQDRMLPMLVDNVIEHSELLSVLNVDRRIMPADNITRTSEGNLATIIPILKSLNSNVKVISGYDTLDLTPGDNRRAARHELKMYAAPIGIPRTEELAMSNAVIDFIANEVMIAEETLKEQLYKDVYTGSSNSIIGLNTAINTGSYGGINGATETYWQSGVDATAHTADNMKDPTHASYVITLLQTGFKATKHNKRKPNLIICSQGVFDIIDFVASVDNQFNKPTTERQIAIANLGFEMLLWRNIPILVDDTLDTTFGDSMYMLNTDSMALLYHPMDNFEFHPFIRALNQVVKHALITVTLQLAITARRDFYRWSSLNN